MMWDSIQKSKEIDAVNRMVTAKPLVALGVTFVTGLVIGWMVLGWLVAPVKWENAGPLHLNPVYQNEWVQMAADSLALTMNIEQARERIGRLQDQAAISVERALQYAKDSEQLRIAQLQVALEDIPDVGPVEVPQEAVVLGEAVGEEPREAATGNTKILLAAAGAFLLLLVLGVSGVFLFRRLGTRHEDRVQASGNSSLGTRVSTPGSPAQPSEGDAVSGAPVARFMTTYMLGDDLYDDSFSIDAVNGDFLGECGVGVSETIGVGEPKKVTAFEIWLFDKNDVRTVTKVLMSEHALGDEALRARLAPKGEPIQARPGETMVLETASLRVTARIVDMQYGSGPLPQNSFFHQLTIELAAWNKS